MDTQNQSPMPSQSPVVNKGGELYKTSGIKQMSFPEAIKEVIEGKAITRVEWGDKDHYGILKFNLLSLHKAGEDQSTFYSWIINDGDLLSTDWVVVDLVEVGEVLN